MTNALKKALDSVTALFTPDDLTRTLQDKQGKAVELEKASAEANNNYFKAKIVDPAKAETFKQEKLRLDTELSSVRDDITALKQMHEDATRDQRLAALARERAAIEKRIEADKAFMTGKYQELAKQMLPGLKHLEETERLVFAFNLQREDDEPHVTSAETALRKQPSQNVLLSPLHWSVALPQVNPADAPFRKALSPDELQGEALARESALRIATRKRIAIA
jgi:hypothetical protein